MYSATHGKPMELNENLIDILISEKIVKSKMVEKAMKAVNRQDFCPEPELAFIDSPQRIGYGATISAPHMHAYALEWLRPYIKEDGRILDVGSGTGIL